MPANKVLPYFLILMLMMIMKHSVKNIRLHGNLPAVTGEQNGLCAEVIESLGISKGKCNLRREGSW